MKVQRFQIGRLSIILSLLLFGGMQQGSSEDINQDQLPAAVLQAFRAAWPEATHLECEQEQEGGETIFEIEFDLAGKELSAEYHSDGTLEELEEEIDPKTLPKAVLQALKQQFSEYKIEEAQQVSKGSLTFYEIEVEVKRDGKEKSIECRFAEDGSSIKSNESENDSDDENDDESDD